MLQLRRSTLRRRVAAAVAPVWVPLNALMIWGVLRDEFLTTGPAVPSRVAVFNALAWVLGPCAGFLAGWAAWRVLGSSPTPLQRVLRWTLAGGAAGFASWSAATILVCLAHAAPRQIPIYSLLMGMLGTGVHLVPGAALGAAAEWQRHRS